MIKGSVKYIINLSGLFKLNPFLSLAFSILILSLAGCPPLLGFFAKYEVLSYLIKNCLFGIAFLVIITSTISCARYLTLINVSISPKISNHLGSYKNYISSYLISSISSFSIFSFLKPLSSIYLLSSL